MSRQYKPTINIELRKEVKKINNRIRYMSKKIEMTTGGKLQLDTVKLRDVKTNKGLLSTLKKTNNKLTSNKTKVIHVIEPTFKQPKQVSTVSLKIEKKAIYNINKFLNRPKEKMKNAIYGEKFTVAGKDYGGTVATAQEMKKASDRLLEPTNIKFLNSERIKKYAKGKFTTFDQYVKNARQNYIKGLITSLEGVDPEQINIIKQYYENMSDEDYIKMSLSEETASVTFLYSMADKELKTTSILASIDATNEEE